jgi:YD repeat-containing protein
LGHQESTTIDPRFGVATSLTNPNSITTTVELDDFGRTVRARSPLGTSTVRSYCIIGPYNSSNTPGCPTPSTGESPLNAARFIHVESRSTADVKNGAFVRVFYNRLGQTVRTVTEAFDGVNQTGGAERLIAQDSEYDSRGAAVISTQPYFLDTKSSLATGNVKHGMTTAVFDVNFGNAGGCTTVGSLHVKSDHPQYQKIYTSALAAYMGNKKLSAYVHACEPLLWYSAPETTYNTVKASGSPAISD